MKTAGLNPSDLAPNYFGSTLVLTTIIFLFFATLMMTVPGILREKKVGMPAIAGIAIAGIAIAASLAIGAWGLTRLALR